MRFRTWVVTVSLGLAFTLGLVAAQSGVLLREVLRQDADVGPVGSAAVRHESGIFAVQYMHFTTPEGVRCVVVGQYPVALSDGSLSMSCDWD